MSVENYLEEVTDAFKNHMKANLIGIYLHGSLAMGCFKEGISDIDLLIVVRDPLRIEEKREIIKSILTLEQSYPLYSMEMSILLERDIQHFVYPTPFELHYSKEHRERYKHEENYLCQNGEDSDLAAHIVVTYERGLRIYGNAIENVFKKIDPIYYIRSIVQDVHNAHLEITDNPVYYTLNLCRVLFYLKEGKISSKKEGGEWGVQVLPFEYKQLISGCLIEYKNPTSLIEWEFICLKGFAEYMLMEISKEIGKRKIELI